MPTKQVLLCKYLFTKAEDVLEDSNSYSAGLSISLFQDAVELLLWTIAKEYPVVVKEKDSFEKLWETLNKIEKNGKTLELTYVARMIELNKARVNFKHYGNLPALSEAEKFRDYVARFLTTTCLDYLSINFDEVSMIDLIRNEQAKERLKEAASRLTNCDVKGSLESCAYAGYYVLGGLNHILPRFESRLRDISKLLGREAYSEAQRAFRNLETYLNDMRDFNLVSLLNVKLADYKRFKEVTPSISQLIDGSFVVYYHKSEHSAEDASFCIDFITKCALAIEGKLS